MPPWVEVRDFGSPEWNAERARACCEVLESNQILFFRQPPFVVEGCDFLTSQRSQDSAVHKNVSYRPASTAMRGFSGDPKTAAEMRRILALYSARAVECVQKLLMPYAAKMRLDYASFRGLEEEGRNLPLHKRNDLLHVDAFPSRPTRGGRILRFFTNIHPSKTRVWITTERFPELARRFAREAGLKQVAAAKARRKFGHLLHVFGLPVPDRSAYDEFMLRFHDWLKENTRFQSECAKDKIEFPPMSTWLVFTDGVPHAVLSGQYALEQTFIIPREALVTPQQAPIGVLEEIAGVPLAV
ncbi:MAG: Kdo hydroxylase family protein [Terriglobales bacterium]